VSRRAMPYPPTVVLGIGDGAVILRARPLGFRHF
jgi:hypothetical protein